MAPVLGVLGYLDSDICVIDDSERLGIFSTEINDTLAGYLKSGLYDGTLVSGGNAEDNVKEQLVEIQALLNGEAKDAYSPVESFKVTVDNMSDFGF